MSSDDQPADDPGNRGGPVDHHETVRPAVPDPAKRRTLKKAALTAGSVGAVAAGSTNKYSPVGQASADGGWGGTAICEDYASVNLACQTGAAANFLHSKASGLFSSGYSQEDVDNITSSNLHWAIYQSLDDHTSTMDGFFTETNNWIEPGNVESGTLASMTWSEIRAAAFKAIDNGEDSATVRSESSDARNEYLTTRERNYIRQSNEQIFIYLRHLANFINADDLPSEWSAGHPEDDMENAPNHNDGEIVETDLADVPLSETHDGLSPTDVFSFNYDESTGLEDMEIQGYAIESLSVSINDITLTNGDVEPAYQLSLPVEFTAVDTGDGGTESGSGTIKIAHDSANAPVINTMDETALGNVEVTINQLLVSDPQGDTLPVIDFNEFPWQPIQSAITTIYDNTQANLNDYIDSVVQAVDSGQIDASKILSPTDFVAQFGDSNAVSRLHAELTALGLTPPDDAGITAVVDAPDAGLNGAEGRLYLNWDWSDLQQWEYEFDAEAGELTIDGDSFLPDSVYEAVFADDSIAIDAGSLEETDAGYVYTFDQSALDSAGSFSDQVLTDTAGELNSFIPVGRTVADESSHAVFVSTEGERTSINESESFTIARATDGDGNSLDRFQISGYNQTTRDPARSLDQAMWYSEQRQTSEDLEEQGWEFPVPNFGDWFGGDGGGIVGLAIISVILLSLIGWVTDLLPFVGGD